MAKSSEQVIKSTLWMGELAPYMSEDFIRQLWYSLGENVNVKVIRDKNRGQIPTYCFVEFETPAAAQNALNSFNETLIPNTDRTFKLNWANGSEKKENAQEYSAFVGDLGQDVTEQMLLATFRNSYPSCMSAKVMIDSITGKSRGYGFVTFANIEERNRSLTEMNGMQLGSKPIRIGLAQHKTNNNNLGYGHQRIANTTVYVGGLVGQVTETDLHEFFCHFGEITNIKIPPGKGCGFVQFRHRQSAEAAIIQANGSMIGNSHHIRLSWGRA
ncbi:uncharacterized protein VTP21DRAFT_509 [Calcarisporiella thermophila]|uniref:uncharacterized protein n=1 Tax=Calcarisporiella thermophila TaxID=911321 RepID=UPI00374326A1